MSFSGTAIGPVGYSNKFDTGKLCPEVQPLNLLYTVFARKRALFVYLLLINGIPFEYLVHNFLSLSTAVNVLSLKY